MDKVVVVAEWCYKTTTLVLLINSRWQHNEYTSVHRDASGRVYHFSWDRVYTRFFIKTSIGDPIKTSRDPKKLLYLKYEMHLQKCSAFFPMRPILHFYCRIRNRWQYGRPHCWYTLLPFKYTNLQNRIPLHMLLLTRDPRLHLPGYQNGHIETGL